MDYYKTYISESVFVPHRKVFEMLHQRTKQHSLAKRVANRRSQLQYNFIVYLCISTVLKIIIHFIIYHLTIIKLLIVMYVKHTNYILMIM